MRPAAERRQACPVAEIAAMCACGHIHREKQRDVGWPTPARPAQLAERRVRPGSPGADYTLTEPKPALGHFSLGGAGCIMASGICPCVERRDRDVLSGHRCGNFDRSLDLLPWR